MDEPKNKLKMRQLSDPATFKSTTRPIGNDYYNCSARDGTGSGTHPSGSSRGRSTTSGTARRTTPACTCGSTTTSTRSASQL